MNLYLEYIPFLNEPVRLFEKRWIENIDSDKPKEILYNPSWTLPS